jgi:hypothetical protein
MKKYGHCPKFGRGDNSSGIVTLTSPSKFLTGTIFLHAHLQAVYYNCVKFHLNPMSRLGGNIKTTQE